MNPYDRTEKIDNYLENNMSNEEKKEFERLLSDSSASLGGSMNLNEEVKMQKAIIQEIQRRALRQSLEEENKKYREEERIRKAAAKSTKKKLMVTLKKTGKITLISSPFVASIAAVMLIMFVLNPMVNILKDSSSPYISTIQHQNSTQTLIGMRSGATDYITNVKYLIAQGNWKDAKKELKHLNKLYFKGKIASVYPNYIRTEYANDITIYCEYLWLQALCEIECGNIIRAKQFLKDVSLTPNAHKEDAKKILDSVKNNGK